MLLATDELNLARGNFAPSGEFKMPVDENDTEAYEILVEWIGTSNPFLLSMNGGLPQLLASRHVLQAARAALRNKLKRTEHPDMARLLEMIREDTFCPNLVIDTDDSLGVGSRLILQKAGNMDLAFNSQAAAKFCQIRDIYEDPNEWQFWLQTGYDTRIRDWHEKVFRTNEQTNASLNLAGDYVHTGAVQIAIENAPTGKWRIEGRAAIRSDGQFINGLTPGNYTIVFDAVVGKTAPANIPIVVEEGKVATATGTYTTTA
jgi:hypothetical protein